MDDIYFGDRYTKYDRLGWAKTSKDDWRKVGRIAFILLVVGFISAHYMAQFLNTYHICPKMTVCYKITK